MGKIPNCRNCFKNFEREREREREGERVREREREREANRGNDFREQVQRYIKERE